MQIKLCREAVLAAVPGLVKGRAGQGRAGSCKCRLIRLLAEQGQGSAGQGRAGLKWRSLHILQVWSDETPRSAESFEQLCGWPLCVSLAVPSVPFLLVGRQAVCLSVLHCWIRLKGKWTHHPTLHSPTKGLVKTVGIVFLACVSLLACLSVHLSLLCSWQYLDGDWAHHLTLCLSIQKPVQLSARFCVCLSLSVCVVVSSSADNTCRAHHLNVHPPKPADLCTGFSVCL